MRKTVLVVAMVALAIYVARHRSSLAPADACTFEQTWYDGDVHFNQELVFDASGEGQWATGGMASDAPHQRLWFQWSRTETRLTAVFGPETRTVGYAMTRQNGHCWLRLEKPFLPSDGQSRHYSDSR